MSLWLGLATRVRDSDVRKDGQMLWEIVCWMSTAGAAAIGISSALFDTLLEGCGLPCCIPLFLSSFVQRMHGTF